MAFPHGQEANSTLKNNKRPIITTTKASEIAGIPRTVPYKTHMQGTRFFLEKANKVTRGRATRTTKQRGSALIEASVARQTSRSLSTKV